MFLGHYGLALAAKRVAPRTSLGVLVLGAQFLDLLWPVLLLTGVERVAIEPGLMEASALDFLHYPWSHSLLAAACWALVVGGAYGWTAARRGGGSRDGRRAGAAAAVVGGLVLSHWFLDLPMHRPDLPLWPGSDVLVGAGLWDSVGITLALELGLLALGVGLYATATRARDAVGRWALVVMIGLLVLFWFGGVFGPPPPDTEALAWTALLLWLFVPWAAWIDRHREGAAESPGPEGPAVGAAATP